MQIATATVAEWCRTLNSRPVMWDSAQDSRPVSWDSELDSRPVPRYSGRVARDTSKSSTVIAPSLLVTAMQKTPQPITPHSLGNRLFRFSNLLCFPKINDAKAIVHTKRDFDISVVVSFSSVHTLKEILMI